ncbi:hypothetical protein SULI_13325 [Saccharolobus solfataricus]|uniref:DUF973 family protein n=3 Tax=Saccharolobus solfataricus TaxID=2287 RepID=Q97XE0_SACS2|nr:hypothetical protein [Saccharolobus solfataricus]AAK42001.1 Hypothetical protein SSO1805 [Saccharolobus solfataricus P2]AKA74716.1 hypothetical protein SULB_2619 [Saccharolobus solfataricus]AKA77411.1 hypothetical protein SULC_2615 [Saccharolobus solfataricus]AKA80102.1 hypothetical protein SULA_2618 [Saccharolobus solfataricus]AZF69181.1 hypothetical protein SULG_13325 [Saccharolobus solfataricus]
MNGRFLLQGNVISFIASIIILYGLILLLENGIYFALSKTFLILITFVWILAIPSYLSYRRSGLRKQWILNYFAIPAIVITLIGMILAYMGNFLGIEVIVLGYIFEPIAGISIYLNTLSFSKIYSSLFFWGALLFTIGLPLYLTNLGIVAVIGDVIKIVGIVGLINIGRKTYLTKPN